MQNTFIQFLRSNAGISVEEESFIMQHITLRQVKEGEVLLQEDHYARELFFICAGVLKIVSTSDKGVQVVHFFLKQGQFCTILNSFNNNQPAHEGIVAACDATLVVFIKEALQTICNHIPRFQTFIDNTTQKTLFDKIALKNNFGGKDATERYKTFLQLQGDIAAQVSLSDTASYLGITLQSLSRIRRNVRL